MVSAVFRMSHRFTIYRLPRGSPTLTTSRIDASNQSIRRLERTGLSQTKNEDTVTTNNTPYASHKNGAHKEVFYACHKREWLSRAARVS